MKELKVQQTKLQPLTDKNHRQKCYLLLQNAFGHAFRQIQLMETAMAVSVLIGQRKTECNPKEKTPKYPKSSWLKKSTHPRNMNCKHDNKIQGSSRFNSLDIMIVILTIVMVLIMKVTHTIHSTQRNRRHDGSKTTALRVSVILMAHQCHDGYP